MILIISICKEPLHELEFVKPIENILEKNNVKFKTAHYNDLTADYINTFDKVIICGTSLKDNDFIKHLNKFQWIKSYKKPLLGICGGAHIIGLILGKKLKKKEQIGLKELNIKSEFLGVHGKLQVYHLHQFQVLPEVFQKGNIYATLFHPEVRNREIIEGFVGISQ